MRLALATFALLAGCRGADGGSRIDNEPPGVIAPDTDAAAGVCPGARDADRDGWHATGDGGTDCDDFDPGVSPSADDLVTDGVDADCDGVDGPAVEACTPTGPEDCDGLDDDCDGLVDDPYAIVAIGTPAVAAVGALLDAGGAALVVGDTSGDAAVDGAVALYDADGALVVRIVGEGQGATFGQQLATGRDLTGDGHEDLVVAAPFATVDGVVNEGRIFVFAGPIGAGTTLDDAVSVFVGGELDGQPGTSLALAPDLTGDGLPELLVGYYRHVLLFSGAPPAEAHLADAFATWERSTGGGPWYFATAPDEDGDGRDELVLGMATFGGGGGQVARWDSGGIGGVMGAEDFAWDGGDHTGLGASLVRVGDDLWSLAGTTAVRLDDSGVAEALDLEATGLANAGDLDGDGAEDLLVGTPDGVVAIGADGEIGRLAGMLEITLQSDRSLAAPTDVDGDGVPDARLRTEAYAGALDGAVAFGGSCDEDGDGVGVGGEHGDCDDGDPTVAPLYGREACNGVDDDCDGVVDSPAEVPLPTRAEWVSGLGDVDGDGLAEVGAVDAEGLVVAFARDVTSATLTGGRSDVAHPFAGAGDTDGNDVVELIVSGADAAWLVPSGASGDAAALATTTFVDGTGWTRDGRVGHAGDRDGDGLSDVWLGVRAFDGSLGVALFSGVGAGRVSVEDADVLLTAPISWDTYELAAARAGQTADLDGDGLDDLLVGNPASAYGAGRAYVFTATERGTVEMDVAAAMLLYGEGGEQMGTTLAIGEDLDGDARDDALIGGATGVRTLAGAACPLLLAERWDVGAEAVALADVDGDGRVEAWLADDDDADGRGAIWRVAWRDEPARVRIGAAGEGLGAALWSVGDTDGLAGGDLVWGSATGTTRVGAGCR